jgi:bifunctional non-homologous end joining protein LigD
VFRLSGERLNGEWTLVRMKRRPREKRDNWLLIKHHEDGEKPPRGDVLKTYVKSVATERTMAGIAKGGRTIAKSDLTTKRPPDPKPGTAAPAGRKSTDAAMPRFREPQLATLVEEAPDGDGWLVEMKYDGYRALIAIAGGPWHVKRSSHTRSGHLHSPSD